MENVTRYSGHHFEQLVVEAPVLWSIQARRLHPDYDETEYTPVLKVER